MEERILKVLFGKSGSGSISPRISLPMSWIKDMGLSQENREVTVKYDENKKQIIIEKDN